MLFTMYLRYIIRSSLLSMITSLFKSDSMTIERGTIYHCNRLYSSFICCINTFFSIQWCTQNKPNLHNQEMSSYLYILGSTVPLSFLSDALDRIAWDKLVSDTRYRGSERQKSQYRLFKIHIKQFSYGIASS